MSAAARRWLDRQRVEDGTLLMVLRILADSADVAGCCVLSQADIAQWTGLAERSVRGSIALLERAGILTRERRSRGGREGRVPDSTRLQIGQNFDLPKATITDLRKGGATEIVTGSECREQQDVVTGILLRLPHELQPAHNAVAPSPSRADEEYIPSPETSKTRWSGRVWREGKHGSWRARVRLDGVDMNIGRFKSEAEAACALRDALADVEHAASNRAGTPRNSQPRNSANGESLGQWLFGDPPRTRSLRGSYVR
ncbi:helix-turn-helix domain-containing protein [Mesorhizobium sp. M0119]|uniref:helix-turn-helix domain-containing protein n=1 Tax=Mesorhizobium sp. M0119 TaxID=2956885 RepID=UPI0033376A37